MVSNGNWFAVSRMIFDHYVVGIRGRPYTEFEAWLWLLAQANYEQKTVINKGETVVLDPGQMMHARIYLSQVWGWTEDKVRWFLKRLESEAMITRIVCGHRKSNQIQILTVCNYSDYQALPKQEEEVENPPEITPSKTPNETSQSHPASTQQNDSNDNGLQLVGDTTAPSQHPATHPALPPKDNNTKHSNNNNNPPTPQGGDPVSSAFEVWWDLFPNSVRKVAKGECLALFRQVVTGSRRPGKKRQKVLDHGGTTAEELIAAVKRYAAQKLDPDYIPAPATWLNQGRWLDGAVRPKLAWWQDPQRVERMTPERWRKGIDEYANGMWPVPELGPPPGHAECKVPPALIDELRLTEIYSPAGIKRS